MVGVVRLLRPINPDCSDNAVVFVLFVFSLAIWTDRTRQRIAVGSVGRYITAVSLLILLLMILRTVKFILSLFTFVCLIPRQYNYTFHELHKQLENQVVPIQIQY